MKVLNIKQDNKLSIKHTALSYFLAFDEWFNQLPERIDALRKPSL